MAVRLVAAAVVLATAVAGCSPNDPPPAAPSTPSVEVAQPDQMLDGAYRMDIAADQVLSSGVPTPQEPFTREYAFKSACTDTGCVAAVSRLDDDEPDAVTGPQTPMDYIGDQWVSATYDAFVCPDGSTGASFVVWQLSPQPDGTLEGIRTVATFGSPGCTVVLTMPITATRTGDVPADAEIDDPAAEDPVRQFAAAGLSGRYDVTSTVQTPQRGTPTKTVAEIETHCARTTNRCLSLVSGVGSDAAAVMPMLFADGLWTSGALWPDLPCGERADDQPPTEVLTSLQLPQPAPVPITTISGTRSTTYDFRTCQYSTYGESLSLTRTGD